MTTSKKNYTEWLKIPLVGDNQEDKETTYNAACAKLDAIITDYYTIYVDNSNAYTLTVDEFTSYAGFIIEDGSPYPTSTITITVPNLNRGFFVFRNYTVEIIDVIVSGQATGTTSIGSGETAHFLVLDGGVV